MKRFLVKYMNRIVRICCAAVSVLVLGMLVYLSFTPNVQTEKRYETEGCERIEAYDVRELAEEAAPLGVVKEYRWEIEESPRHGACLGFYIAHQYADVYIGQERVYRVRPSKALRFGKTIGCDWVLIPLQAADGGKEIRVCLTPVYERFRDWEPEFILGTSLSIYKKQISEDAFRIICAILSIVVGALFSVQKVWKLLQKKKDGFQPELGFFSVLLGVWMLTNIESAPLLFRGQPMLVYYVSLATLMIGALPILRFMKKYLRHQIPWILDLGTMLASVVCIVQLVLQIRSLADLREVLWITHMILSLAIVTVALSVIYAWHQDRTSVTMRNQMWLAFVFALGVAADLIVFYVQGGSSNLNISMLAFLLYVTITSMTMLRDHAAAEQRVREQEAELAANRVAMMMRQIQPHFIFNSLLTIRYLCKRDSKEAVDTIDHFSRFLRGSMDAVTLQQGIPFEKELNLVRDYLYMEKKRFGDKLRIQYNITETDFWVPALSIQPIVENAVKHGIRQKLGGGTIFISTYRDGADCVVQIKDDGIGFDPTAQTDDGRTHVGMENVRNRLALMCNGSLYVHSVPGEGTEVTLKIPAVPVDEWGEEYEDTDC